MALGESCGGLGGRCAGGDGAIGGWRHRDIRPVALGNANEYTYRPTEVALVLNTPFSIIRTFGKSVFTDPGYYPDKAELAKVFDPLHRPDHQGMTRRKNVVVFIIESYGREYIGSLARTVLGDSYKGYTPFTDSLAAHSATFRYSYCNGRKSIDGMPSILSSVPMFIKPFILTPQSMNKLSGLAGYLGQKGYYSAFFHGARTGSMGFNGFANATGFKDYFGREDFCQDKRFDGDKDFDGYWAIWDEPFMQYYCAKMGEMRQPFVTALFTASSIIPTRFPTSTSRSIRRRSWSYTSVCAIQTMPCAASSMPPSSSRGSTTRCLSSPPTIPTSAIIQSLPLTWVDSARPSSSTIPVAT